MRRGVKVSRPLDIVLPAPAGVLFAESIHRDDFTMPERSDPFHKVVYVLAGKVEHAVGGESHRATAAAGSVLLVPKDVRHRVNDLAPATLLLLCFSDRFLEHERDLSSLWLELRRPAKRHWTLDRQSRDRLEQMWRRALHEQAHGRRWSGLVVPTLAIETLVMLARGRAAAPGDAAEARVDALVRELDHSFFEPWNLDRAANRAGLSRRRFSELFRVATGQTFWERLNELRLNHAAHLLRAEEHSVLGVMFACGFGDLSHFYRLFRQRFGAAPKRWLERHRRGSREH
jgi:AraC-like DNA-binding protein